MSNHSDYDRRVKDILDRVAKGHLSSDEAATLIAAAAKPTATDGPTAAAGQSTAGQSTAAEAPTAAEKPTAAEAPKAGTESPAPSAGSDAPSPSVWAEVVDSPDVAGVQPSTPPPSTSAPSAPQPGTPAPSAPQPSVVDESAVQDTVEGDAAVQDTVVEEAPADGDEEEADHSNVPVPSGVRRVTVRAVGRRVRLIGEPAINGVAVDGPHVIKRDGDTLAISSEGDMGVSIDGFSMLRNPTDLKSHVNGLAKELWIRVNPMLEVEIEVTGGSVVGERLPGLSRVRVTAGTAKVTDVDGPIDVLVQAGTATLDAQITKGRSRVRVESGAATVNLRRGSDVRVHTEAQLGRVTWTGAVNGQSKDVEIGRGRAALDVEVLVGSAQITSD
ncbi:hypothetical protein [Kribbella monticola]|uniref:hypothetical protein n=1 Tax=Kribbella monticola TaxID=2185285 RepID=UPI000DD2FCAA|nr:hypothetical protein [Kribbella monticola]